jgi:hypothetical protein
MSFVGRLEGVSFNVTGDKGFGDAGAFSIACIASHVGLSATAVSRGTNKQREVSRWGLVYQQVCGSVLVCCACGGDDGRSGIGGLG